MLLVFHEKDPFFFRRFFLFREKFLVFCEVSLALEAPCLFEEGPSFGERDLLYLLLSWEGSVFNSFFFFFFMKKSLF